MNKYFFLIMLQTVFSACTGSTYYAKIDSIHSEILFNSRQIEIYNQLRLDSSNCNIDNLTLYLLPQKYLKDIVIRNCDGELLNFTTNEEFGHTKINIKINNALNLVQISYKVDLEEIKKIKSRQLNFDRDEFYILSEISMLPSNKIHKNQDAIYYDIKINNMSNKYQSIYVHPNKSYSFLQPSIIGGNFNTIEKDDIIIHSVRKVNADRLSESINKCIDFYSSEFGKIDLSLKLQVYILNRSGGYGLPYGIILNDNSSDYLISHEIAHLWWGNGVMSAFSLNEALAEISSMNYFSSDTVFYKENIKLKNIISTVNNSLSNINISDINTGDKKYISYSYSKVPLILNEFENILGPSVFRNCLKEYYKTYCGNKHIIDIHEFVNCFPDTIKPGLSSILKGDIEWPDYYIANVEGSKLIICAENINCSEIVPIEVKTINNKLIKDTVIFDPQTLRVQCKFEDIISEIYIDKDCSKNQSCIMNDYWGKDYILRNKFYDIVDDEFHNSIYALLKYLFTNGNISIDTYLSPVTKQILSKAKAKLNGIELYNSYIKTETNIVSIIICFKVKSEFHIGKIEFNYIQNSKMIEFKNFTIKI